VTAHIPLDAATLALPPTEPLDLSELAELTGAPSRR
jgi:hypothetical protein